MSELKVGDELAAGVAKTDKRVTLAQLEARVEHVEYLHPGMHKHMTIAVMTIDNGFALVGKSAPADPRNFDEELGRKFAREDCLRQLWAFEGYLLREMLSADGYAHV